MSDYEIIGKSEALYLDACVLPKIDIEAASEDARLTRILVYSSFVAFGEFFNVAGKKLTQQRIGIAGYLFSCRALMIDQEMGKFRRAEPVEDRVKFFRSAQRLETKYSQLGGGDIWHLMPAIELQSQHCPATLFSFDADLVSAARMENIQAVCGNGLNPDLVADELKKNRKLVGAETAQHSARADR